MESPGTNKWSKVNRLGCPNTLLELLLCRRLPGRLKKLPLLLLLFALLPPKEAIGDHGAAVGARREVDDWSKEAAALVLCRIELPFHSHASGVPELKIRGCTRHYNVESIRIGKRIVQS